MDLNAAADVFLEDDHDADDVSFQDDKGLTIAQHAQRCMKAFETCMAAPQTIYGPLIVNDGKTLFTDWARDMNVHGPPNDSLDYRLRDEPTFIVNLIHRLLDIIEVVLRVLTPPEQSAETPTTMQRRTSDPGQADVTKAFNHSIETEGKATSVVFEFDDAVTKLRLLSHILHLYWVSDIKNAQVYIWECRAPCHQLMIFQKEDELQEHLRTYHEVPEAYIMRLSDAARRSRPHTITDDDEAFDFVHQLDDGVAKSSHEGIAASVKALDLADRDETGMIG